MGLFSSFFGSPSDKLSNVEFYLPEEKLRRLVSGVRIDTLASGEERLVEETLLARRRGDGKISLRQIDEELRRLQQQYKISVYDRRALMKAFGEYCESRN